MTDAEAVSALVHRDQDLVAYAHRVLEIMEGKSEHMIGTLAKAFLRMRPVVAKAIELFDLNDDVSQMADEIAEYRKP